jgi:hypothetical protein
MMSDEKSEEQTELLRSWEKAACAWERVACLRGCAAIVAIVVAFACAIGWAVKG